MNVTVFAVVVSVLGSLGIEHHWKRDVVDESHDSQDDQADLELLLRHEWEFTTLGARYASPALKVGCPARG